MYTNSSRSYLKMASGTPRRTNGTPWRTGGTPTAEYSSRGNDGMNDMNEEDLHEFISRFPLTEMQKTMLEKRLSGMTWEEIAAERKVSRCGIYGYMRRIRKIFMASRDFKEIFAA